MKKRIAILGSTGSIGTQALDVISCHLDQFEVEVLTANRNADLLIRQAKQFKPNAVVIVEDACYQQVNEALKDEDIKVFAGRSSLLDIVEMSSIDMVLVALVGFAGLEPTYRALQAGKTVALANKETLVVGGAMIMPLVHNKNIPLLPVDSEHSAIFQCLVGEWVNPIEKITLTASGGPFFGKKREELQHVLPQQALKHPNWSMGSKVTIDSATMMNKGLEMIEAKWLFNLQPKEIEIVVHPQSIVHSLVHFADGSVKAQMALPDMRLPIQYALSFPQRLETDYPKFDLTTCSTLTFYAPDRETFSCIDIAYQVIAKGGNMPCVMNAANEIAVMAFLKGEIGFLQISDVIAETLQKVDYVAEANMHNFLQTDALSRVRAKEIIEKIKR
ncbi:MAG: 1-deoxy-D-xylulose-5-phosphate reductoisomerase [Bacteroidales bacterium]|jgi:1-deoxy-D-xylulose-5-phosphate reductoisomerase|nr:1-deoxy-D-xylulose-5-phosphate reductoisomerase [Bacteroidales bacterium]MBR4454295.1 1-deoxy-D-xylulose-5-phosphate reductoisomerase [Bacteroidales bacterium]